MSKEFFFCFPLNMPVRFIRADTTFYRVKSVMVPADFLIRAWDTAEIKTGGVSCLHMDESHSERYTV